MEKTSIYNVKVNDVITLTNGDKAVFIKLNRTRFVAKSISRNENLSYPISMFAGIESSAPAVDKSSWEVNLKPGKLFYIVDGGKNLLFKFERFTPVNIVAVLPSSGGRVNVRRGDFEGAVL